jgi:predicted MPP superfamily phosphohydrolase
MCCQAMSGSKRIGGKSPISRRRFLVLAGGTLAAGATTCLLCPLYATRVEPYWLEVSKVEMGLEGLPTALDGLTVAQLGDFHLGQDVSRDQVRRAVEMTNALNPDLIVLMGDFVTGSASYSAACAEELSRLEARYGTYAVLGNHDNWTDADEVSAKVGAAGIDVLRDEARAVDVGESRLWLLGIEDTGFTAGYFGGFFGDFRAVWDGKRQRLAEMLDAVPDDELRLLLVHNPDFTEMLPEGRIDLALCGHTHGGQVRVPFVGAPVVPSFFGGKYASGLVQGASTLVYVNRGIGLISPALRFNCRPEVTLLYLRGSDRPQDADQTSRAL